MSASIPPRPPTTNTGPFISYSHQDNLATRADGTGDHIQWANGLHEQLETYRIPDGYRDRATRTGEPRPERFFPTFRDEAELPTSHDLGGQIRDALRRSRFLIVIASPRSARSRYVNEEVRYFRELGRGDRILTLIIDGEPNVCLAPESGWPAEAECFCPALVHPLHPDGRINESALLPEEPIAADTRLKESEPARELRASERDHSDGRAVLDFMKLKLLAGLMGVGLDELVQRDKRRAEEELRRVRREASRTEFLFARQLLDLQDRPKAYARLAKSIRADPSNRAAVVLALKEIRQNNRGPLQRFIHAARVNSATFSPDGMQILTASADRTAQVWDAATGRPVGEPLRHDEEVDSAVFSPDGRWVLTRSGHEARLWEVVTGRPAARMLHEGPVLSARFSGDGGRIRTTCKGSRMSFWDAPSGASLASFTMHDDYSPWGFSRDAKWFVVTIEDNRLWFGDAQDGSLLASFGDNPILSARFSPDDTRVLTILKDKGAQLWDVASDRHSPEPIWYQDDVHSGEFSPDGTRMLTVSSDNAVRVWDGASGDPLAEPMLHANWVTSAAFSPDGDRILTTAQDKNAYVWSAITGQPITRPMRHPADIASAGFCPDGTRVLTVSKDKSMRLWDAANGRALGRPMFHYDDVWGTEFSPDGASILCVSLEGSAWLWDAAGGKPMAQCIQTDFEIESASCHPDGSGIVLISGGRNAGLWDASRGKPVVTFSGADRYLGRATFSPDGLNVLIESSDRVLLFETATGRRIAELLMPGVLPSVESAVFSPDGTKVLTASSDGRARLWDAATGAQLAPPLKHKECVNSAKFNSDGTRILTASDDGTACLWDAASGRLMAEPMSHQTRVLVAAFSPDDRRILTGGWECAARLWDAARSELIGESWQHSHFVHHVQFSPDGSHALTSSQDGDAFLWELQGGKVFKDPLKGSIGLPVFSPDGAFILTASQENSVLLWDTENGQVISQTLGIVPDDYFELKGGNSTVLFSPDGAQLLTVTNSTLRIWDASIRQLLAPDILRLADLLEIFGGCRLNERGRFEPTPRTELERVREDFATPSQMDCLLEWWWSNPFTRHIHPSSKVTVPEFVRCRIRENLDHWDPRVQFTAVCEAREAFPHHPLVLLSLLGQDGYGNAEWRARDAVARLLAEPHYHTPLPQPRGDLERTARAHELTAGLAEDCYLAARLLQHRQRFELARQVLARAVSLAPENEDYLKLKAQIG